MTVTVMRGSATESRFPPLTVTFVPPLYSQVYANALCAGFNCALSYFKFRQNAVNPFAADPVKPLHFAMLRFLTHHFNF